MMEFSATAAGYRAWLTEPERWLISQGALRAIETLRRIPHDVDWPTDDSTPSAQDGNVELAAPLSEHDQLAADLIGEAMGSTSTNVSRPADAGGMRLLPDASDDPAVAAHYRDMTQHSLIQLKHNRLVDLHKLLTNIFDSDDVTHHDPIDVAVEDSEAILGAFSDIRLVLAEYLDIGDDLASEELQERVLSTFFTHGGQTPEGGDPQVEPDDLVAATFVVVGYLQQSLVDQMLERLIGEGQ